MLFVCHPRLSSFSLGAILTPKRNWRQCLCKILEWPTKSITVCYGIFCSGQFVERCTGIAHVKGSNPVIAWSFSGFCFGNCKSCVYKRDDLFSFITSWLCWANLGCVPLEWSASKISDTSDLGSRWSNEPMNTFLEWIQWFLWRIMIRVISGHWSWSGSSQWNAPLVFAILRFKNRFLSDALENGEYITAVSSYHTKL